jgi:predicted deacylase
MEMASTTIAVVGPIHEIIGYSAQKRPIDSYTFGDGKTLLVFVGAIHGGYEWNTALLAWEFIDYLETNPEIVPKNLSVAIIPALNPDGLAKITGKEGRFAAADIPAGTNETGRFNANNVDLNRNFDCNWQPRGIWRQKEVSAGSAAFSEPESAAIRDYVLKNKPAAVVFWHSQSNAVYGSMCNADMSDETRAILNAYAKASGYPAKDTFDQYQVSGDATDWLASIGIPAITVELAAHQNIEWQKNLAGINALFQYFK